MLFDFLDMAFPPGSIHAVIRAVSPFLQLSNSNSSILSFQSREQDQRQHFCPVGGPFRVHYTTLSMLAMYHSDERVNSRQLAEMLRAEVLSTNDDHIFPTLSHHIQNPSILSMFSRLGQLSRHLSRPLPNYAHASAAAVSRSLARGPIMTSPEERQKRMIHTAGCIIIGDEVLGGKVRYQRDTWGGFEPVVLSCPRRSIPIPPTLRNSASIWA